MPIVLSIYNKSNTLYKTEDITPLTVISIGRHRYNNVQLADSKVSRFHAALFHEGDDRYFLQDLGSRNGLLINGGKRDYGAIMIGDKIEIGGFTLIIQKETKKTRQKEHKVTIFEDVTVNGEKTFYSPVNVQDHISKQTLDPDSLLIMYRITHLINRSFGFEESLQSIAEELFKTFNIDRVLIIMLDDNNKNINCLANASQGGSKVKISRTLINYILKNKQILIVEDVPSDEKFKLDGSPIKSVLEMEMKAVVCIPLKCDGEIKGILYMDCFKARRLFEDKDLHLLAAIGEEVSMLIERNTLYNRVRNEKAILENMLSTRDIVIGNSPAIKDILIRANRIAKTDITVLLTGETGTGKGNLARFIHRNSGRKDKPFIEINCSAIPENLLESELFGHKKGSFTHATEERIGKLVYANGGTVFLDEIGDLSLMHQAKLLKVIEDKIVTPLGSNTSVPVDVRIIAATNKNIEKEIKGGRFRQDLYARFTIPLHLSPLRERKEDIPLLAGYFLKILRPQHNPNIKRLSNKSVNLLQDYAWPNNIRELNSSIIRALVECHEHQTLLSPDLFRLASKKDEFKSLKDIEKEYIIKVLKYTNCNKEKSAKILKIAKQTLYNKWNEYKLTDYFNDECPSKN